MDLNLIESVVVRIQGLSGTPEDVNQLHTILESDFDILRPESALLAAYLPDLDPSIHSLGYLYILEACTTAPVAIEKANELVILIARFIHSCAAQQIRLAPDKFISVCKRLKENVLLLGAPIRGVSPLLTAIRKLQSSSEHLTALHPDFLQLCLMSKCYKFGSSILGNDIFGVDQPRDFLLYFYYGGMVCIGQKQFPKALELLHKVVTAPMSPTNAISVEAYKKYTLVSLIHHGEFSSKLPHYNSYSIAERTLRKFAEPYFDLKNCYSNDNVSELEAFIHANTNIYETDHNHGLVKQVVSSMYKSKIQRLTQTYLTLSLQDIANRVELETPKEAEMHVLKMIQDGDIYASINQKDGMVRFLEVPEQYNSVDMIDHLDSSIQRTMALSKKLMTTGELISCDPQYLEKVGKGSDLVLENTVSHISF